MLENVNASPYKCNVMANWYVTLPLSIQVIGTLCVLLLLPMLANRLQSLAKTLTWFGLSIQYSTATVLVVKN